MQRIMHDGSQLGPGQYEIDKAYKAKLSSPKGYSILKSKREGIISEKESTLGPGTYDIQKELQSLNKPSFSRAHADKAWSHTALKYKKRIKNNGSIRADFEEEGEPSEEDTSGPGPGQYLKQYHTSFIGNDSIVHDNP